MTEFTARNAGTQAIVTDTDRVIFERIGKGIISLGHRTNEDTDALLGVQGLNVVLNPDHGRVETEGHFPAVGRQMVRDRVLNYFQQLLVRVGGANGKSV